MKAMIRLLFAITISISLMSGCGQTEKTNKSDEDSSQMTQTKESAGEEKKESDLKTEEKTSSEIHPYAWLGLQDMPKCTYLDFLSSGHYVRTYDAYVSSVVSEETEAVNGADSYKESGATKTYSIGGKVYVVNDNLKTFLEQDLTDVYNLAVANLEAAMANGTNLKQRVFQGKGKESIPLYSAQGDGAEYDYYEYLIDASVGDSINKLTERFYMKDGDVFAVTTKAKLGSVNTEMTEVIKSISGDIPEEMLTLPDLEGYEKQ